VKRMSGWAVERMATALVIAAALPAHPLIRLSAHPLIRSSAQDSVGRLRVPTVVQERARTDSLDNALLVQVLEKRLRCTCGCNLDVFTCRTTDFTCETSPALHADVLARLRADGGGMTQASADRVVAAFVAQYGESILMQPPKSGFNWTAYLTPFAALFVGLSVLAMFMRRWTRADQRLSGSADGTGAEASAHPPTRLSDSDAERLKRALESVDS
jgi:cytochrome c-type biogenesis protein CcmH/NrfF